MPPVEDVAFLELMGGRGQDMAPRRRWIDVQLSEDILELISDAECSACLVEAGAGAHAGADRLVGSPAVDHEVKGRVGWRDLDAAEPERKSVVKGKSVAVRVDVGGSR